MRRRAGRPESIRWWRSATSEAVVHEASVHVERALDIVVQPHLGQEPGVRALVDGRGRLARQDRAAPHRDDVLQRARGALVGDRAELDADTASIREEQREEPAQLAGPAMHVEDAAG